MKKFDYFIATILVIIFFNCESPGEKQNNQQEELTNTLEDDDLGGKTGHISEYFYNFDADIAVDFYRFSSSYYTFDYEQYLNLFQKEPSVLTLKTFPEYLVNISPAEIKYTERSLIDSLTALNTIENRSVLIQSTQFKNINSLVWDTDAEPEAQRYKPNNSDWIFDTTTVTFKDTFDLISYRAVIDTPIIDQGVIFIDQAEWVDTTYYYVADEPLQFNYIFSFARKQLNSDSLMFRVNTDCNDNGIWDEAETDDTGNGIWDPHEPFYDMDGDGNRDGNEPYEDRNCNEIWDGAETYTDINGNDEYDESEEFVDEGNGLTDSAELFTDVNGNGQPDAMELFIMNDSPNHLLVDWTDAHHGQVVTQIFPGDSLTDRWGNRYYNMIEEVTYSDPQTVTALDKDSTVTLFTNRIIGHIESDHNIEDYFIVKTEWEDNNIADKDYDYLLFKEDQHIYKLIKPSYFKPYGYYWSEGQIESGFWHEHKFADEVVYYTFNGLLREGEEVESYYYDTTSVAVYRTERSFKVDVEDVTVPAKRIRGFINNDGDVECYANPLWSADAIEECPGVDTTFVDAFKVTNTLTQVMIGSDVEYGERNTTWLVKGFGLVKDELEIRWTEYPMSQSEQWVGISRWELGRFSITSNGRSEFANELKRAHAVKLHELQNVPVFLDPFQIKRTAGLQRVTLPQ